MAKIKFKDLPKIRRKNKDKKIIFASGGFDLTHAGHVLFFEDAKRHGDLLVVMVGEDEAIRRNKGKTRPILNEHVRMKMVNSLKPVDYTLIDDLGSPDKHPLHAIDMALGSLKPDIYVINEDASDIPYRKAISKKHGTKLLILERYCPPEFEGISTSKIIEKIKKLN